MTALDLTCRVCMAQPGEPCHPYEEERGAACHPERIEDAAAMTRVTDPVSVTEFGRAAKAALEDRL